MAAVVAAPSMSPAWRYSGGLCSSSGCAVAWSPDAKRPKPVPLSARARCRGGRCSLLGRMST